VAVGSAILKFWAELLNPDKILVTVLVLKRKAVNERSDAIILGPNFGVLAGDFDLVKFPVLKFREIMA
jgi:hypothetical protein